MQPFPSKLTCSPTTVAQDGLRHSQVLQIPPRELRVGNHLDLPIALLANLHDIPQVPHAVVHLDLVVQEFLEHGNIEDFVRGGLGGIDDELRYLVSALVLTGTNKGAAGGKAVPFS